MRLLLIIGILAGLLGCASVEYSKPDEHGFVWFKDHEPADYITIEEVPDIELYCQHRNACACAFVIQIYDDFTWCRIMLPKNPHPALLEHEMKHCQGFNHPPNPIMKSCPKK